MCSCDKFLCLLRLAIQTSSIFVIFLKLLRVLNCKVTKYEYGFSPLCIQNGTLCFTGDVPRWNRRNSRCNRSCSVSKSYGTALQKYRSMCIKPAFPGEFETWLNLLFCWREKSESDLGRGKLGHDSPQDSRGHLKVSEMILNCAYFYFPAVRSLRERFTSGITNTSWA